MAKVLEPKLPNHATVKKADAKARRGYKESFDRKNGKREPLPLQPRDWIIRSSGLQKLKLLVKTRSLDPTS